MTLQCGIVGLPNVGKSTLFNALTNAGIPAENYPFCTIDPNIGIVEVPDIRLKSIAKIVNPAVIKPAIVEFVDIAGLVAGASKGEGLGNQFLANIRMTDAIIHVVRCFDNKDVIHVNNKIHPLDDIYIINTELTLADIATVEKSILKEKKADKQTLLLLNALLNHLNNLQPARTFSITDEEKKIINQLSLLTMKPVLYLANTDDETNNYTTQLMEFTLIENANILSMSVAIESELSVMHEDDKSDMLKILKMKEPGLNRLINATYSLLNLQTYFTAGPQELRAWTIKHDTKAPQAAGIIHTDIERGFIRAETICYSDFIKYNGEKGAKEAGKMRLEGKDYIVKDGDILHFRHAN